MREDVVVIGGGLAGSEAAWQAATRGARVTLYEMRPKEPTQAHKTGLLAELVCSNSLGSGDMLNAPGILKEEMRRLNSLVIRVADEVRVPAGTALAVDRDQFAQRITQTLESHPNVRIIREEIKEIPSDCVCIIATGPLTSDGMATAIRNLTHSKNLYFFDAISPIIDTDSIKMELVFRASRYDRGGPDYLNCPMDEASYDAFHDALLKAEKVQPKEFEKTPYFEGCIPIEVMAERGRQTMLYGPLKPVGLEDPRTRTRPHAVVQLRAENLHGSCYNMVGFQTKLTYPEQRRVFRMIPGLEQAECDTVRSWREVRVEPEVVYGGPAEGDGVGRGRERVQPPPEHVCEFPRAPPRYVATQDARHRVFCRATRGSGRLHRIGCHGRFGGHQCGQGADRTAPGHSAARDGAWESDDVYYDL